jgi:alkanesulfonate monooxygenase SsuD/methylene tetrahydromethanopterin reductase-like flavin-dependent oxidoreductase (luciferase family)
MQRKEHPISTAERSICDRIGFCIEGTDSADAISRIREAEQAGVRQVWATMGGAGLADALTTFAVAVAQTEFIRVGTAIIPAYPLHPLTLAQQALAVHDIAPGRLRLGIGPSHRQIIEDRYGLSLTAPLAYLKEYLEVMRSVLWEDDPGYNGAFFKVGHVKLGNMVIPMARKAPVPLLISALGLKAFRLAGEISDGALSWMCPLPYLLNQGLPALRAGAEAWHRPAPPLVAHMLVAMSTDEAAVQAATRQRVVQYAAVAFYARMFAQAGFPQAVEGNEAELDALAQTLLISGDEATVRNRIQELLESGLDELMLQLVPVADEANERKRLLQMIGSL